MSKCATCSQTFGSRAAYEQHAIARKHGSSKLHKKKVASKSAKAAASLLNKLDPPVDADGQWVWRADFKGKKSFGFFECKFEQKKRKGGCDNSWTSAHAFPNFTQGCKQCEKKSYPVALWRNSDNYYSSDRSLDDKNSAPHDKARCAACQAGVRLK